MARSHVLVPSAGTIKLATYQYTDGANVKDDEITAPGEPFLPSYTAANFSGTSTATASAHHLQIMAGASNRVRIRRIVCHFGAPATAAALNALSLIRLTTAGTGGTVLTPALLDQATGAAGCTAMSLPVVKGAEGTQIDQAAYIHYQTAPTAGYNGPCVVFDFDGSRRGPLIINAGVTNGLCVKNLVGVAAGALVVIAYLDESPY